MREKSNRLGQHRQTRRRAGRPSPPEPASASSTSGITRSHRATRLPRIHVHAIRPEIADHGNPELLGQPHRHLRRRRPEATSGTPMREALSSMSEDTRAVESSTRSAVGISRSNASPLILSTACSLASCRPPATLYGRPSERVNKRVGPIGLDVAVARGDREESALSRPSGGAGGRGSGWAASTPPALRRDRDGASPSLRGGATRHSSVRGDPLPSRILDTRGTPR